MCQALFQKDVGILNYVIYVFCNWDYLGGLIGENLVYTFVKKLVVREFSFLPYEKVI